MTQALLIIDVQNDFCPGGALAVDGGDEVVPVINA
ncbi:MAG: nicotinamidase, partial [Pseudomonadota bacterium]